MLEIAGGILLAIAALFVIVPLLKFIGFILEGMAANTEAGEDGCGSALLKLGLIIAFAYWGLPFILEYFEG